MHSPIDGFYAAYLTGSMGQGFVMFVFRHGIISGADAAGAMYDGTYTTAENGYTVVLNIALPPNTLLVQGVTTGSQGDKSRLEFHLPADFLSHAFIRINAKHGPVNVKIVKLRELDD